VKKKGEGTLQHGNAPQGKGKGEVSSEKKGKKGRGFTMSRNFKIAVMRGGGGEKGEDGNLEVLFPSNPSFLRIVGKKGREKKKGGKRPAFRKPPKGKRKEGERPTSLLSSSLLFYNFAGGERRKKSGVAKKRKAKVTSVLFV